mmetsp:Transcript_2420/g.3753  ORF Transcript_2420/g.3753 Transcript_2420/m.3753 type:complete len:395 (+) Transcript_2420:158-1342(+)
MRRAVLRRAQGNTSLPFSKAQRVLVVSKDTRYENELAKLTSLHGPSRGAALLKDAATSQGSDLQWLSRTHEVHEAYVRAFVEGLQRLPRISSVQVVKAYGGLKQEHIAGADFIFSMGGDGTFLRTASLIQGFGKAPILCGINTDPQRSEGFLCVNHHPNIRESGATSLQLPDFSPVGQSEMVDEFLAQLSSDVARYITRQRVRVNVAPVCERGDGRASKEHRLLALNDVLVAEHEAQKASYYELRFAEGDSDDQVTVEKQKSSGLLISTGTGSTAWSRSVTSLQPAMIQKVLDLLGTDSLSSHRIAEEINRTLSFEPSSQSMRFVVREPIVNGVFTCDSSMGFARSITVRSRSPGMHIFADGQLMAPLPLGHVASFSIHPEDALRAVHLVQSCH